MTKFLIMSEKFGHEVPTSNFDFTEQRQAGGVLFEQIRAVSVEPLFERKRVRDANCVVQGEGALLGKILETYVTINSDWVKIALQGGANN